MAIGRAKPELPHPPGLISWRFEHVGTRSDSSAVKPINVVDAEVGDIAVIAELAGGGNIGTSAEHEDDVTGAAEAPIACVNVVKFAAENVPIPGARHVQVVNREHWVRACDLHGDILTRARGESGRTTVFVLLAEVARSMVGGHSEGRAWR
jgi:hypothetical protein